LVITFQSFSRREERTINTPTSNTPTGADPILPTGLNEPAKTIKLPRIIGLDIARAFAIIGMVLVNFKIVMGTEEVGNSWLHTLTSLFDGRAAATFVVLAGIGASIGSRRARESVDGQGQRRARVTLAKRALFLFAIGWLFFPLWPADILHFYGVYLALGALFLFASGRRLWLLIGITAGISFTFIMFFDFMENWNIETLEYQNLDTPIGFLRNLFFDGFHPVFPWVAFYFFGMWLGRTNLRDKVWRKSLAIRAAIVVVVAEGLSLIVLGPKGSIPTDLDDASWQWLFSAEPLPPLPLYLLAGGGTAILVIVFSFWIGDHLSSRITTPLVDTGQLALTIYLAHVVVGMAVLESFGRLYDQSLPWAVFTSLAFSASAILFSWVWRRRFARGPLEALMKRLCG
jgi:uncharacterized membrane protein YeiB